MSPRELFLDVSTRFQGLHGLDNMEVGDLFQFGVFRGMEVLLGHHNTLFEKVLVNGDPALLGHQHPGNTDNVNTIELSYFD